MEYETFYNRYADGCDLSNQSFTDLSLSIDPEAMIFMVGWHAMQSTTSENKETWFSQTGPLRSHTRSYLNVLLIFVRFPLSEGSICKCCDPRCHSRSICLQSHCSLQKYNTCCSRDRDTSLGICRCDNSTAEACYPTQMPGYTCHSARILQKRLAGYRHQQESLSTDHLQYPRYDYTSNQLADNVFHFSHLLRHIHQAVVAARYDHGTVAVKVYSRDRIGMCGQCLHAFSFLHIPDPDTLVKRAGYDQIRLRVIVDTKHIVRVALQDLDRLSLFPKIRKKILLSRWVGDLLSSSSIYESSYHRMPSTSSASRTPTQRPKYLASVPPTSLRICRLVHARS